MIKVKESFKAYGHELIQANHKTTLEITKDNYLTKRGNCIIAIRSEKTCKDLKEELKKIIKNNDSFVKIILKCNNLKEEILAKGSSKLILKNDKSIVIRKSDYIDDRTLAIKANKSSKDLKKEFIEKLKSKNSVIRITIEAWRKNKN